MHVKCESKNKQDTCKATCNDGLSRLSKTTDIVSLKHWCTRFHGIYPDVFNVRLMLLLVVIAINSILHQHKQSSVYTPYILKYKSLYV